MTMKSLLYQGFLVVFALVNSTLFAQQDTLYFTSKWKPTVKDSAAFFRPPVQEEGGLYRVQDFYRSGQLQMTALSTSDKKDLWQGKVTWYNEDGSVFQEGTYADNRLEGDFITYLGNNRLVAQYKNGRFVSGKRNTAYGYGQMYFEQEGDTLYEVLYDKDLEGIREEHYGTKNSYRFLSKYYDASGSLIGERTLLPNNYYKGLEVFYYSNPMRVRDINYYPFGQLLISEVYYENGQVREKVEQTPSWSKTYYTPEGEELGKIVYRLERDRLKPKDGTEFFFSYTANGKNKGIVQSTRTYENGVILREELYHGNGQLSSETSYEEGAKELQISYDEAGNEIARMIYQDYMPFEGTEMQKGRTATYKSGKLIEEISYYFNTKKPQIKKTSTLEVYYDKEGKVLGELKLKDQNGYPIPFVGKRFSIDYRNGHLSSIEEYKEAIRVRLTSFRNRKVGKNTSKTFKKVEEYGTDGFKRIRETKFYSNGTKQSDITYSDYKEIDGLFYDSKGKLIGTYDYTKKNGTRYVFFGDSDQIELREEVKDGKTQRLKRYTYGKTAEYGQIHPLLEQDFDIDCCASYYTAEGDLIAKLVFKDQLPWEGMAYDRSARTKYAIKEGKRNGQYQKLDYNQNVLEEGQFVADKEEGAFKYFDYQGNLKRTALYKAGNLDGTSQYFDEQGTVIAEMEYENGLPMNGTKILDLRFGDEPNQETYKAGVLTRSIAFDKNGKSVTTYAEGKKANTIVYAKKSKLKRLSYGQVNTSLHGEVVRYHSDGTEQHRAVFSNGRMESGTVCLTPRYQDNKVLYMQVTKAADRLSVKFIDFDNRVVLNAEETLIPGSSAIYLDKLDVNLDYLSPSRLY